MSKLTKNLLDKIYKCQKNGYCEGIFFIDSCIDSSYTEANMEETKKELVRSGFKVSVSICDVFYYKRYEIKVSW